MKANIVRVMLAIVAMLTISSSSNAAIKGKIYNNDIVENGKVVAREVCSEEDGQLILVSRSEMEYNADGLIALKKDYTWDSSANEWKFQKSYTYTYTETSYTIVMTDAKGKVKTFEYGK